MFVIMFKVLVKMYLIPFQKVQGFYQIHFTTSSASTRGRGCFTPPASSFITFPKTPCARTSQTPFNVPSSPGCLNPWLTCKLPPLLVKSSSTNPQLSPRARRGSVALRVSSHYHTEQLCLQHCWAATTQTFYFSISWSYFSLLNFLLVFNWPSLNFCSLSHLCYCLRSH